MEELPSFGCRWCCKAALCVFFYPLPLFVAFTPEYILPSCKEIARSAERGARKGAHAARGGAIGDGGVRTARSMQG